jgi:hypothetical protein
MVIVLPFLVAKKLEWAKAYAAERERRINRRKGTGSVAAGGFDNNP